MLLLTIEALLKTESLIVVGNSRMPMPTSSCCGALSRVVQGPTKNISTLLEQCQAHYIEYCNMIEEMLCYIKQTAADNLRLPADPTELGLLPIERFNQLEILVADFSGN